MNKRNLPSVAVLIIAAAALAAAYGNFCRQAKYLHYEAFDLNKAQSWQTKDGNVFRTASRGNFDQFLLAKDNFEHVSIKLNIINPRDCGIVFNYVDSAHYSVLYFDTAHQSVLWLETAPDGNRILQRGVLPPVPALPVELEITRRGAKFSVKGQTHSQVAFDAAPGSRLFGGLMIKDADAPKVIFNDVRISGETADGIMVQTGGIAAGFPEGRYVFSAFLLCGLMVAAAFILARILAEPKAVEFKLSNAQAGMIHLAAAALLFLPFIFRREILVSSADNLGQIFPLFFFSKQNFLQILSGEGPILWNPYSHNGIPFFSNHWNMTYYPLNWPIFLLPDNAVMSALTFRTMAEVFLIGLLGYRLFLAEFGSPKWAMLSSLMYQLGSFLIFSFTLFPVTSLVFAMTLYLYSLWSLDTRKDWLNAVMLTGSSILILTGGNMAFVFYGGLTVAAATLYRLASDGPTRKKGIVLWGSLLSAFLISAIRIIPCIFGVSESNRVVEHFYTLHDRAAMFVRFFVPEIVGWLGPNFLNALTSPNWNFIYEQADLPSNTQNTFLAYFGIIPAILVLSSLLIPAKGKLKFWKWYCWSTIALGLMVQPLWGVFNILTFPFNHYSYYIIILPLGVGMLAGLAGKYWQEESEASSAQRERIGGLVLAVQVFIIVMVTYLFPKLAPIGKFLILLAAGWWIGLKCAGRFREKYLAASRVMLWGALWVWFFVAAAVLAARPVIYKESILPAAVVPIIGIFLIAGLSTEIFRPGGKSRLAIFAAAVALIAAAAAPWVRTLIELDPPTRNYFLDMSFAQIKFLALALSFFAAWRRYQNGKLGPRTCGIVLIAVVFLDLLAFNYRFDNVVALRTGQAFDRETVPYRPFDPELHQVLDLKNFRMDKLHQAGLTDNENLISRIPSYSGVMGHMPKRFSNFIVNFGYPARTVLIYPSESTDNARFLDLCAVKYSGGSDAVRASALSRMMLYTDFSVVEDDSEVLKILQDGSFIPQQKVLISRQPEGIAPGPGKGMPVAIERSRANEVGASVTAAAPGIVLFIESFDKGWRAYVDGLRTEIIPANYAFMAIPIEKGEHTVVFRYEPPLYMFSLIISGIGLLIFGVFKIYLLRKP